MDIGVLPESVAADDRPQCSVGTVAPARPPGTRPAAGRAAEGATAPRSPRFG